MPDEKNPYQELYYKDEDGNYQPLNAPVFNFSLTENDITDFFSNLFNSMEDIDSTVLEEFDSDSYYISLEQFKDNFLVFVEVFPENTNHDVFCVYKSKQEEDARGAYSLYVTMMQLGRVKKIKDCVTGAEVAIHFSSEDDIEE